MFKVTLDWEQAHERTRTVEVTCNALVEQDSDGCVLRLHTLPSIFANKELPCPVKLANAPAGCPPVPCAPAAPRAPEPVKLNTTLFDQLLAQLKSEAHGAVNNSRKLTSMEIHERLLAMKE